MWVRHCNLHGHSSLTPIYLYIHKVNFGLLRTRNSYTQVEVNPDVEWMDLSELCLQLLCHIGLQSKGRQEKIILHCLHNNGELAIRSTCYWLFGTMLWATCSVQICQNYMEMYCFWYFGFHSSSFGKVLIV